MAQTDDLTAKIGEILSSPEQMRQIQSLASMLGLGQEQPSPPPSEQDTGIDPAAITAITGALSKMNAAKDDPGVSLLLALRPLLGERRQHRVDEATKMLKLARMLPLLQETGILNLEW